MPADHRCLNCGAQRPGAAPAGLCPQCLLRLGLGADLSNGRRDARTTSRTPVGPTTSVLDVLTATAGPLPRIELHETEGADRPDPLEKPNSSEMPDPADRPARLQLFGEIARGGMGAVLRGRDPDLGREVAIKVLLDGHRHKPDLIRRFVEEAQIGGQLQHPGVVPVYELGTFGDARPYFAMKLVKGRTFAALLAEREGPAGDLSRLLSIFLQVAQTVAYAHARGVIHRDLKPSNVMVGSFGEVQVMDWGLAKVLPRGGLADDKAAGKAEAGETVITTARSGSACDLSVAGSVMGTPAYMAPEQARGESYVLDERCDVFALGSILCEILTGKPAFLGRTSAEVQRKAARGDLTDAFSRLDDCTADTELVNLAKDCLAVEFDDRPGDAGVVAARCLAYLGSLEQRMRTAEVERAAESARAEEAGRRVVVERQRRRYQLGLTAALLALTTTGGLGTTYFLQQRAARTAAVDRVLREAITLRGVAAREPEDVARWEAVLTSLRQADEAVGSGGDPGARRRLAALRVEAQAGADAARRDRALLDAVADVRSRKDDFGFSGGDAAYARAFREAGLDLDDLPPALFGARLKARPASVALAAASALDDWALVRRSEKPKDARWRRPLEAARVADPDPFRDRVRAALLDLDEAAREAALQALALDPKAAELPPASAVLLALTLKDVETAVALLRAAAGRHPDDVWVNHTLAERLGKLSPAPREERVRYYSVARALRPGNAHDLARLLDDMGRTDEALGVFADLAARRPADPSRLAWYGQCLRHHGRPEATEVLERAVAACGEAVRLKPDDASAQFNLGLALGIQEKRERLEEAVTAFRAAVKLQPEFSAAHSNLGFALRKQMKLEEAAAEQRKAIDLAPNVAKFHSVLGDVLLEQRKLEEAVAELREAVRLEPDDASVHLGLGFALQRQGNGEEAIAEYRKAVLLKPTAPWVHFPLGVTLERQGDYAGALAAFRKWVELQSKLPGWQASSGRFLEDIERKAALAERLPGLLKGDDRPRDNAELLGFAQICYARNRHAAAARLWAEALANDPKLGDDRSAVHCYSAARAAALAAAGLGKDDPPPDDAAKTKLRGQALDWLKGERDAWAKLLDGGDPKARTRVAHQLQDWKVAPELASVRDPASLAKLSDAERELWRALWTDVDALHKRAAEGAP
jgi:serine/threonine-protein kinase